MEHRISHLTSPPHTPEHNGVAERKHRHVVETGLTLLNQASVPRKYWPYELAIAVYITSLYPLPFTKPLRASTSPPLHEKAATGFAVALVSVCQSKNSLGRTQEDVRRLMEFLAGEEMKSNKVLVNDVFDRGRFGKHLKGLVKILAARGKSEILDDVLIEFERICNELVVVGTTKLVWIS